MSSCSSAQGDASPQKSASSDFSSHFVIKSSGSYSNLPATSTTSVSTPEPSNAPDTETPPVNPTRPPNTSPLQNIPPRRALSLQHPFMKVMSPSSSQSVGHLQSSPRPNLIAFPDSPMDFSYQPVSPYCFRKNKLGELEFDPDLNNNPTDCETILRCCGQRSPIPIDHIFNGLKEMDKIGEGVYGEVFSGKFRYFGQCSWVYKVVAIAGEELVNGEKQKGFMEVCPEIVVSQELSRLKGVLNKCYTDGYAFLKNARIAKGRYPLNLLSAWDNFHQKYESDNDRPDFENDQLYMILEFEYAGQDIESLNFRDARQTLSIVLQVAHILAVGECALEFEHRDLHWGNVLVQTWKPSSIRYLLNGQTFHVPSAGVKAAVIDFTISRVKSAKTQEVIYLDLREDEEQFLGTGDHQFDIYRMMRDHNRNNWEVFSPKSNIYWLHYLANKLFVKGRYGDSSKEEDESEEKSDRKHNKAVRKLREFSHTIMEYPSAYAFIVSEDCAGFREVIGLP